MEYIYLSHFLNSYTPSYGNRDSFLLGEKTKISEGATANSYMINFSTNHLGTHIDLSNHFYENGKKLHNYLPGKFIFDKIVVLEKPVGNAELIKLNDEDIEKIRGCNLVMLKTGYQKFRNEEKYWNDNPGIDPSAAEYLRLEAPSVRCIGFDFISLTSWKFREEGREAHKKFLEPNNEILIIEDMDLSNINEETSINQVIVAPLLVDGIDSAPVTVFAKI